MLCSSVFHEKRENFDHVGIFHSHLIIIIHCFHSCQHQGSKNYSKKKKTVIFVFKHTVFMVGSYFQKNPESAKSDQFLVTLQSEAAMPLPHLLLAVCFNQRRLS